MNAERAAEGPSAAAMTPGSRWFSGRIALNTWVNIDAPAAIPARASSRVASVCPIDTATLRATSFRIASSAPGSSGAIVMSFSEGSAARRSKDSPQGSRFNGGCAPSRRGEMNGPSMCIPRIAAASVGASSPARVAAASAIAPCARSMRSTGDVTAVGNHAVVPSRASFCPIAISASVDAVITSIPCEPLTWRSTKPGRM